MILVWFQRAIRDLEAIRDYVAQDNPTAAQQLSSSACTLNKPLPSSPPSRVWDAEAESMVPGN
jgi:plasmid stabilization system protein ParE